MGHGVDLGYPALEQWKNNGGEIGLLLYTSQGQAFPRTPLTKITTGERR